MAPKTFKERIEDAVSMHSIESVVVFPPDRKLILCPLPFHQHRSMTPSFSIFFKDGKQYWKCHGYCNRTGDVVDLVGFLYIPGYDRHDPKLVQQALERLDSRYEPEIVRIEEPPKLSGGEWRSFLPPGQKVYEYASARGLAPETLARFRVGQNGSFMTMPCFEEGLLRGIKMRNVNPDESFRYYQLRGSIQGLFNYDRVRFALEPVLIVKGEIPCMLLDQLGFLACAPTGGEGGWQERWRTALALAPKRIVVGDNDTPGRKLGERRAEFLSASLHFPPEAFKDVDQWILADLQEALAEIRRWMEE